MSGMKFRRTCTVCNATFFSPDRKAAYCLKCMKKRVVKHVPAEARAALPLTRAAPRPAPSLTMPLSGAQKPKAVRAAKADVLTPEVRRRIIELYEAEYAGRPVQTKEMHSQIANRLWIKRQLVADCIREMLQAKALITEEVKTRAIEMYQRFVESGHRPDGGRRRAISAALGIH